MIDATVPTPWCQRASDCQSTSRVHLAFVSRLGAEHVIDYQAARFEGSVRDMDVVFDTVGGDTLQRSWGLLRAGGRMITTAADSENTTDARVKQTFFIVEPNREQLTRIGDLLEAGDLKSPLSRKYRARASRSVECGREAIRSSSG